MSDHSLRGALRLFFSYHLRLRSKHSPDVRRIYGPPQLYYGRRPEDHMNWTETLTAVIVGVLSIIAGIQLLVKRRPLKWPRKN
jgi:hypothetical protein